MKALEPRVWVRVSGNNSKIPWEWWQSSWYTPTAFFSFTFCLFVFWSAFFSNKTGPGLVHQPDKEKKNSVLLIQQTALHRNWVEIAHSFYFWLQQSLNRKLNLEATNVVLNRERLDRMSQKQQIREIKMWNRKESAHKWKQTRIKS